jgi:hypothetical protein
MDRHDGPPLTAPQEDERLSALVRVHGTKKWSQIAAEMGSKGSKQVRVVSEQR